MTGTALSQYPDTPSGKLLKIIENGNTLDMLPKNMDLQLYKRGLFIAVDKLKNINAAELPGLAVAVGELVKDGLLPDNKHAALISYGSKKVDEQWVRIYTPVPMVLGILKVAFDNGIENWQVELVYEKDEFHYDMVSPEKSYLKIFMGGDRGEIVGYFGCAELPNGKKNIKFRSIADILKVRNAVFAKFKHQEAAKWNFFKEKTVEQQIASSTWTTHPEEMYLKTGIRYQMKRMPLHSQSLRDFYMRDQDSQMKEMGELRVGEPTANDATTGPTEAGGATEAKTTKTSQQDDIIDDGVVDADYVDVKNGNTAGGKPLPSKKQKELDAVHKELDKNGGGAGAGGQGGKTGGASRTTNGGEQNGGSDGDPRPTPPPPSDSWGS